jgi:hypothetical protein
MGNTNSKRSRRTVTYPVQRGTKKDEDASCTDSGITLTDSDDIDGSSTLSLSTVTKWEDKLLSDPKVSV